MKQLSKIYWFFYSKKYEWLQLRFPIVKFFLYWAYKAFIGKASIMSGRIIKSNGGYTYYQCEITKLPVNKNHT
jgi:hypothetical protein